MSFGLGSQYRTNWNTANDVTVTFDGFSHGIARRTLEWDNHHEGFEITVTANFAQPATTLIRVFDDCTLVATIMCNHAGVGSQCIFGTANSTFPGSFHGSKIRLLFSDSLLFDYSLSFHYAAGGNCRSITNIGQRFCAAYINDNRLYNFASNNDIDIADLNARALYDSTIVLYNTSVVSSNCNRDLRNFACQEYFFTCDSNRNVDKTPCGTACNHISDSCGANPCFDTTCHRLECPNSAAQLLGLLPLLSLLFFWLSL